MILMVATGLLFAGCTQSSGNRLETPVATVRAGPAAEPATPGPAAPATTAPAQVVTIVHQVSLTKDIRDRDLLFSLQVPVEWNPGTYLLKNTGDSGDLVYRTDLISGDVFYILTYAVSRSQDQAYRDQFRKWSPAPAETTVTINGLTCDRFESDSGGKTHVAYVVRKGSANERGYASVLVFAADDAVRFQKDDFEKVAATFGYFSAQSGASMPGADIPRINAPA